MNNTASALRDLSDEEPPEHALTIDGEAVQTASSFEVRNPADGSLVAICPEGSPSLIDRAVASARRAFPLWSSVSDAERAVKLMTIADLIEKHHDELSTLITREQGKPQSGLGANMEVEGAAVWTRVTSQLTLPEEVIQNDKRGKILVYRRPVGVVGSITPWNWPMMIAVWHIMPAIRTGCTVVIKPSPFTPLSTLRLVQIMNEVLPPGVINVVAGSGELGAYLSAHPGVDKVVFTGSIETGKKIMIGGAQTLKRLTLELGGNDAGIVLPNTAVEPHLERLFWGCFMNSGQTCAALKRLYVHADQYEEFVTKFSAYVAGVPVGNGLDPVNLIGPLSNEMQLNKVAAYVEDARERGGRIVTGGKRLNTVGFFYAPTVIADATDDALVVKEEQFGPVIPILKYSTVDEAIARANSLNVGLGGSVWGDDAEQAARYATRMICGTVWVNQHGALHPKAPFGGVKNSGIGVEFSTDGLREYTTTQVLNVAL